jgi:hypothetical protein
MIPYLGLDPGSGFGSAKRFFYKVPNQIYFSPNLSSPYTIFLRLDPDLQCCMLLPPEAGRWGTVLSVSLDRAEQYSTVQLI